MSIEQEMKAENARLKADVGELADALKFASEVGIKIADEVTRLKAEVERLTKRNKFLEQIDSYLQDANQHSFEQRCNELEAEVERLTEANDCLDKMHEKEMARSAYLCEEVNRTTAWGRGLESDLSHARVEISFLKAEVENANRINRELLVLSNRQATEIRRLTDCKAEADQLKAEVERLIKAGDALAKTIGENGVHDNGSFHDVADSIDRWHAAKEGKPSV